MCRRSLHCTSASESWSYAEEEKDDDDRGRRVARSSPEGGAPAKEREMVRRSRSVGRLDWLAHRVCARALARSTEVSSWACLPLAAFFLQSWCYFQLLLASLPPLPHPAESLPAVSYPTLLSRSYFVACTHSTGLSSSSPPLMHSFNRPHADLALNSH